MPKLTCTPILASRICRMDSMRSKLIMPSMEHKTIDGTVLSSEREMIGLSQAAFAAECEHSQQFQQQLEGQGSHEIRSAKADQILTVLEKYKQSLV